MMDPIRFFINNLRSEFLALLILSLTIHITSHTWHLEADKHLIKSIPKILSNTNDNEFVNELFGILISNLGYLILYAVTMFIIELIGKLAVKNAVSNSINKLLNANLANISQTEYEKKILSIVHHSENVTSAIRNLFIEFPRKIIACRHFLIALGELSSDIMLYSTGVNIIFAIIIVVICFVRKCLISKVVESNINFSINCSDISTSIQSYKVDNRLNEFQNKINNLSFDIWKNSSLDSLAVAFHDSITSFSGQFMVGFISYLCRPLVLAKTIAIEDLLYGISASSKFIEKMIGIFEYAGDVVRQYKSFSFFISINNTRSEKIICKQNFSNLKIVTENINTYLKTDTPNFIHFVGPNGVGKTTLLLNLLGVAYEGATSRGACLAIDESCNILNPSCYRNDIAFVQQAIPLTHDTVGEYMRAVVRFNGKIITFVDDLSLKNKLDNKLWDYVKKFINSIGEYKKMKELSGGQAKFIQILAAIMKLLLSDGKILVLDEPSNNLDMERVGVLCDLIKACLDSGITILIVTHDNRLLNDQCLSIEL